MPFLLTAVVALASGIASAQPYGLSARPAVGKFLNGKMPESAPTVAGNWSAVVAFTNLNFFYAVGMTYVPGTNRLCVWEREGRIYTFDNNPAVSNRTLVLNITNQCQGWDACGLLGVAFHPGFVTNHFLFAYYTWVLPGTVVGSPSTRPDTYRTNYYHDRLSRFTLDASGVAVPGSELVLVDQTGDSVWHKGGGMFFHPQNGFLYVTDGDDEDSSNSQVINRSLFGGIWRLDVDQRGGVISHPIPRQPLRGSTANYYIPNDNPFVGQSNALEEFYALGLRSPHRMTCDPVTGRIFIGEVGDATREEIDVIEPSDPAGLNFQWPQCEGFLGHLLQPYVGVSKSPVLDYTHGDGQAVIGGYVYRGTQFAAELGGKYIFGDNVTRSIWALDESTVPASKIQLCIIPRGCCVNDALDHLGLSSFGIDQNGEIYMLQMGDSSGLIFKLALAGTPPVYKPFPPLLSQTGAFTDTTNLVPGTGLIPYTVNSPLWSDGAVKQRWLALPTNSAVGFATNGEWSFPTGATFLKHFELPVNDTNTSIHRRLETRLLVRDTNGTAYGLTYKWRPDNSDADLLTNALLEDISITTSSGTRTQQWYYPSPRDCLRCHTVAAGYVLGVKTRQLNGNLTYPSTGVTDNQLRCWNHIGLLSPAVNENSISNYDKLTTIGDVNASLEYRVRSYLDANCAQCHRPGAVAEASWDARYDTPLSAQHIINGAVFNSLGITNAKVVVPQDISHSILFQRASSLDSIAMPPLAKNVIDAAFTNVLSAWIESLPISGTSGGPLNRWPLDETSGSVMTDVVGGMNGNYANGTILNRPGAAPYTSKSIYITGTNTPPNVPPLNYATDTLTITAWLRRNGTQPPWTGVIFCRSLNTVAGLEIGTANELRYSWNDVSTTWGWNSGLVVPDNQWVLTALVVEPAKATLYLRTTNQLSAATNSVPNTIEEFDGPLYFGWDTYDGTRRFKGWLDDVRVYPRALSLTEIQSLYNEGFVSTPLNAAIQVQGGNLRLNWTGGVAPYQIQIKTNLTSGAWQNWGVPTYANSLTLVPSNRAAFYRVSGQ